MRFARPDLFVWMLILVSVFVFLVLFLARYRRKILKRLTHDHLLGELLQGYSEQLFVLKNIMLVAAFVLIFSALARPQWGFEWQKNQRQGLDIVVAIDTSRSMLTEDIRPSRLERTKFAVKDLIRKLKGDRIGLVAFSGEAFPVCPLTTDYSGVQITLDSLSAGTIPRGGTSLERAIQEAIKGYSDIPSRFKVVIVITDGESLEGDPLKAARAAAEKGIRIYTVGMGTKEGELIRLINDQGQPEYLKDKDGNAVKSRLNENLLKEIAAVSGGVYIRAGGAESGLEYLYDQHLALLERRDIDSDVERKYHERFQWFLSGALLLIVLETLLSTKRMTG
jgi:Ca-activated chloride channel family protein